MPISEFLRNTLTELLDTPSPSGFEDPAAAVFSRHASTFTEHVDCDRVGNVTACVNPNEKLHVAVIGHIDEIGLIVTKIDDKGFIRVMPIGGWDVSVLVGQRVQIINEQGIVYGVLGRQAIHQIDIDGRKKMPKIDDLWIDIGVLDADQARQRVRIGDPVVIGATSQWITDTRIVSRSIDDRLGAAIALDVARRCDGVAAKVTAVGSTREEIGGAGARAAAYATQPDVAIIVDVTAATDIPSGGPYHDLKMGEGPIINRGAATSTRVSNTLVEVARTNNIPHQIRGLGTRTATDTDSVVAAGPGIACGLISIPGRYLHSPCEMADTSDAAHSVDLIVNYIASLTQAT